MFPTVVGYQEANINTNNDNIFTDENPGYFFFNGNCTNFEAFHDYIVSLFPEKFTKGNIYLAKEIFSVLKYKFGKIKKSAPAKSPDDILFQGKDQSHLSFILALYYNVTGTFESSFEVYEEIEKEEENKDLNEENIEEEEKDENEEEESSYFIEEKTNNFLQEKKNEEFFEEGEEFKRLLEESKKEINEIDDIELVENFLFGDKENKEFDNFDKDDNEEENEDEEEKEESNEESDVKRENIQKDFMNYVKRYILNEFEMKDLDKISTENNTFNISFSENNIFSRLENDENEYFD